MLLQDHITEKGGGKMSELSDKMVVYRAKHRMSQKDFAELCGVSTQTINSIETGKQDPTRITEAKIRLVIEEED